jgi:hypothetical protein
MGPSRFVRKQEKVLLISYLLPTVLLLFAASSSRSKCTLLSSKFTAALPLAASRGGANAPP